MEIAKLRNKTKEELMSEVKKTSDELTEKRHQITLGKDKKTSGLRVMSKDIAQMKTVLREKEILEGIK